MTALPETRYAQTVDGVHIAYQVLGEGPVDLVYAAPWVTHLEYRWEFPRYASYLRRIASFSRLIMFDRRGLGLSDPVPADDLPDLEKRMDDLRAVMDEVGSERAVIYGASESGSLAMLFAATHPERTIAMVLHGTFPSGRWEPDAPWGWDDEYFEERLDRIRRSWGTEEYIRWDFGWDEDEALVRWWASYSRRCASPGAAIAWDRMDRDTDVRPILSAIQVPTLILHRQEDEPEANRYLAEHIRGAEYVALQGEEHVPYVGDQDSVLNEIERFVLAVSADERGLDRVLATVLFTDLVGSTARAAELGDRDWADLLEQHHAAVRGLIARFRGREVATAGDGFFATFDGPARAVRAATEMIEALRPLGLELRAGVHTGEVQTIDQEVGGMAVVIGARIGAMAESGEVLVSSTVKDLTAGSGLEFADAGEHELKGVPDRWRLYRVRTDGVRR